MQLREVFGVMTGVLILAGISVAIVNGGQTANIFTAAADGFANVVRSATLQRA
jgi:uncharacterized iron-regulated membrane protein